MPGSLAVRVELAPYLRGQFVGRVELLAQVRDALASSRLVTLLGPPGVGKTRIAVEILSAIGLDLGAFVDLSEVLSAHEAGSRLARSVSANVGDEEPWGLAARLLAHRQNWLVILDNVEQIASEVAGPIASLLDRAPHLKILVTSRVPLGLPLERRLVVPPLGTSSERRPGEASSLLVARLGEAGLPVPTREVLDRLAELLDGLPLAIELAAARARVLAPAEMLARLDHDPSSGAVVEGAPKAPSARFRLLGRLERSPRRWSLEESIESSMALLDAHARSAIEQASVFRGGCSLAAAEAVIDVEGRDVLDVIDELQRASLVSVDTGGSITRFRLLLSIREHAEQQRERRGDNDRIRDRHASWVLQCARQQRSSAGALRSWLDQERENVTAAMRWCVERRRAPEAISLATIAADDAGEPYETRERWLDAALALSSEGLSPRDIALARLARGDIRRFLGRASESLDDLDEALSWALRDGDQGLIARAHASRGNALTMSASWPDAREAFERALACHRASRDLGAQARVIAMVAATYFNEDDWSRSQDLLEQALSLVVRARDDDGEVMVRISLGITALARGSLAEAASPLSEGLFLARRVGNRHWEAMALGALARLKLEGGDAASGRDALEGALREARRLGVRRAEAMALIHLGGALLEARDPLAEELLLESARLARIVCPDHEPIALILLSYAAVARGDLALARSRREAAGALVARFPRPSVLALVAIAQGAAPDPSVARAVDVALVHRVQQASPSAQPEPAPALVVGPSSSWFVLRPDPPVSLRRRVALARILDALVALHASPHAVPLSARDLVTRGWPGERLIEQAGLDRVYAAIATLRRLGLRTVLLEREGYLLDPRLEISHATSLVPTSKGDA
jgi:predicted ATPase